MTPPLNHETEKIYTHWWLQSSVPGAPIQLLLSCQISLPCWRTGCAAS